MSNHKKETKFGKIFNVNSIPFLIIAISVTLGLVIMTIIMTTGNIFGTEDKNKGDGDDSRINIPIDSTIGRNL